MNKLMKMVGMAIGFAVIDYIVRTKGPKVVEKAKEKAKEKTREVVVEVIRDLADSIERGSTKPSTTSTYNDINEIIEKYSRKDNLNEVKSYLRKP